MRDVYEPDMVDDTSHDMSLGALSSALYARKYWILIPTLFAFLLALAYVTVARPRYTADAQILLENQESYLTRAQRTEGMETAPTIDETWIGSQVSLITSRDVAREVVEKLGLIGNPDLDPVSKGLGVIQRTMILFGLARNPLRMSSEDRTIETVSERLSAFSPIKTQIVMVDFWAHDPVLAANVANEVAAIYLERQTDAKRDLAKDVADGLSRQITTLNEKLASASDDVERYRAASGLLAGANNMTISAQQLADLNTDLTRARTDEANSQAKAALIRQLLRQGRVAEVPDVANNDLVRRISEQRVTANAQLALEANTLGPRHPRILELKAEIEGLDSQLRLTADSIAISLENDSRIAASRVANIQAALDQQKQAVETANKSGVELRALEQIEAGYRGQLDSATTKYQEALSRQSGATPADARIIASATAPDQPSFPQKPQVIGLATLAAFVLSLGVVVGRELVADRPLSNAADHYAPAMPVRVVDEKRRPVVSTIDRLKRFASARVTESPDEESLEASAMDDPEEKIAAKSTTPQGVNIVATRLNKSKEATDALISFARTLARDGRPVIVDLNSRDGELAKVIGPQDGEVLGLTDLLDGGASFTDVIHRDAASRLHFVPFGSKDTFNPDDLDLILDALSRTYDFVLLAAPPFPGNPMTKALAPYADFVVLATAGERDDTATQTARAELGAAGAPEVLLVGGAKQAA